MARTRRVGGIAGLPAVLLVLAALEFVVLGEPDSSKSREPSSMSASPVPVVLGSQPMAPTRMSNVHWDGAPPMVAKPGWAVPSLPLLVAADCDWYTVAGCASPSAVAGAVVAPGRVRGPPSLSR